MTLVHIQHFGRSYCFLVVNFPIFKMPPISNSRAAARQMPLCTPTHSSRSSPPVLNLSDSAQSPSREPRFIVGSFETRAYDQPSDGEESRRTPNTPSFHIEVTHIRERDLLSPPLPGRRWSESSVTTDCASKKPWKGNGARSDGPRWPGIIRSLLRLVIILESAAVLGLVTHSTSIYLDTRTVLFSDGRPAWSTEVNLFPARFLQVVASLSLATCLLTVTHQLWRRVTTVTPVGDQMALVSSGLMAGLWVASVAITRQHDHRNDAKLAGWACYRAGRPINQIVNYNLICAEQVSLPWDTADLEALC